MLYHKSYSFIADHPVINGILNLYSVTGIVNCKANVVKCFMPDVTNLISVSYCRKGTTVNQERYKSQENLPSPNFPDFIIMCNDN